MIFIILISLIILEAIYEAIRDNGNKTPSGVVEWFFLAVMLVGTIELDADRIWYLIYVLYRYALFATLYNLIRKLRWDYLGSTKIYDNVLTWIFIKIGKMFPKPHVLFITKLISLTAAVGLTWRFWPF